MPRLNKFFVYGTLKQDQGNHRCFGQSVVEVKPATVPGYTLYIYRLNGIPFAYPEEGKQVTGEVVTVNPALLEPTQKRLDQLESNGKLYQRTKVTTTEGEEVWMYISLRPKNGMLELGEVY